MHRSFFLLLWHFCKPMVIIKSSLSIIIAPVILMFTNNYYTPYGVNGTVFWHRIPHSAGSQVSCILDAYKTPLKFSWFRFVIESSLHLHCCFGGDHKVLSHPQ